MSAWLYRLGTIIQQTHTGKKKIKNLSLWSSINRKTWAEVFHHYYWTGLNSRAVNPGRIKGTCSSCGASAVAATAACQHVDIPIISKREYSVVSLLHYHMRIHKGHFPTSHYFQFLCPDHNLFRSRSSFWSQRLNCKVWWLHCDADIPIH